MRFGPKPYRTPGSARVGSARRSSAWIATRTASAPTNATVIATAANPRFTVSRADIDRAGPTYTIDTLRDLRGDYPDADLYFITGADALSSIMSWHDWEDMFALAEFVGVTRPGYELTEDMLPADIQERVHLLDIPAMAISSTDCRERAAAGRPVWYLVPDGVVQYIAKHRLYA